MRRSILIVDDVPANIAIVAQHLEAQGICVLVAQDGEEALERACFSQPDLILLDVKMPRMDGLETCRRLKAMAQTRDIPVIFMTALSATADMMQAFAVGGVDYVIKPFQLAEVMARVNTHLSLRLMHRQLAGQNASLQAEITIRRAAQQELLRARDELEYRVGQRTQALARANASLMQEVTERGRAEAALSASEARFRSIVESSPVPLVITALDEGRILFCNQPFRDLFGLAEAQATGFDIRQCYAEAGAREAAVAQMRRDGTVQSLELEARHCNGTSFWVAVSANPITFGETAAACVGLYDITARKRAELKVAASEASLANAQRLARLGDWEWRAADGSMRLSTEMCRILGVDEGRIPSLRGLLRHVHPHDRHTVVATLGQLLKAPGSANIDVRLEYGDVSDHIVQLQAERRSDAAGRCTGLVGTLQDITERKRIEQELLASREQLRELAGHLEVAREEERRRIAMEIHDELGQLLTALKMDVSLLRMKLAGNRAAEQKADEMRELVERTIGMVRHVASHLRPAALNYGMVSALEWLTEDFNRRHRARCRLSVEGPEPQLGDPVSTAVFRIVQESLTNAARHARATRVTVSLRNREDGVWLVVSDDGCGFDVSAALKGYSYGLLGMQERARMIGGYLKIDSDGTSGTTVSIQIPRTERPEERPEEQPEAQP
ncbi:response regulator [Cupriavidus necator]|uniref:hybrid sensor histidine kinase/response regulator n=1 Tax=Cupriavidus necator TaxID=106590 RepID=UPI00339D8089